MGFGMVFVVRILDLKEAGVVCLEEESGKYEDVFLV